MPSTSDVDQSWEQPKLAVTADSVVFTSRNADTVVALVERANPPFQGMWALPGGFVETDEDLSEAASRELAEETGLHVPTTSLIQLGAYGAPGRDPRMRVVSVVFWAFLISLPDPVGGSDAAASRFVPVSQALADDFEMAFDHQRILSDAVEAAQKTGLIGPGFFSSRHS